MPAYLIANVEITDTELIKAYMALTPAMLEKYDGRFLVRGGDFRIVEGEWNPKRLVLIEFDSYERANAFYDSAEYKPLMEMRQAASNTDMVLVDGISKELAKQLGY